MLKNAHLLRSPCQLAGPSSLRRTYKYASGRLTNSPAWEESLLIRRDITLRTSGALHPGIFEHPGIGHSFRMPLMIGVRSRGFTLIELIIVMVIISLLAILVTPRLTKSLHHLEVRGASKRISAILRYCRSESINRSRIYSVSFDAPSRLLSVQSMEEGDGKSTLERSYPLPEEIQVEKIEVGKTLLESSLPTFEFYPSGGSNGGTALVRRVESRAYLILVDPLTGTVKVEEAKQQ